MLTVAGLLMLLGVVWLVVRAFNVGRLFQRKEDKKNDAP